MCGHDHGVNGLAFVNGEHERMSSQKNEATVESQQSSFLAGYIYVTRGPFPILSTGRPHVGTYHPFYFRSDTFPQYGISVYSSGLTSVSIC